MNSLKINQNIDQLYNKNGLMQKYGGEVFISILIIFIVGVIFVYLHVLNNLESVKKNWQSERCNPFIIPLAGFINNTDKKNKSNTQYTIDNFEFCLTNIIKSSFNIILDSFRYIISGISDLFKDLFIILGGIISWFMAIISWCLNFLDNVWGLTLQNISNFQLLLNKIRDTLDKSVGIMVVVLYTQMLMFRMSIMWMITQPILMIAEILTQFIVNILLMCLKSQILTLTKWLSFMFCTIKTIIMDIAIGWGADEGLIAVTSGATSASSLGSMGASLMAATAGLPFVPISLPGIAANIGAASFSASAAVVASLGFIVSSIGSLAAMGVGLVTATLNGTNCATGIFLIALRVGLIIDMIIQITLFFVSVALIILLWTFNKKVLGAMNIKGYGIPGLSF